MTTRIEWDEPQPPKHWVLYKAEGENDIDDTLVPASADDLARAGYVATPGPVAGAETVVSPPPASVGAADEAAAWLDAKYGHEWDCCRMLTGKWYASLNHEQPGEYGNTQREANEALAKSLGWPGAQEGDSLLATRNNSLEQECQERAVQHGKDASRIASLESKLAEAQSTIRGFEGVVEERDTARSQLAAANERCAELQEQTGMVCAELDARKFACDGPLFRAVDAAFDRLTERAEKAESEALELRGKIQELHTEAGKQAANMVEAYQKLQAELAAARSAIAGNGGDNAADDGGLAEKLSLAIRLIEEELPPAKEQG